MAKKGVTYVCIGDEEIEIDLVTDEDLEKHGYGYLRPKKNIDAETRRRAPQSTGATSVGDAEKTE